MIESDQPRDNPNRLTRGISQTAIALRNCFALCLSRKAGKIFDKCCPQHHIKMHALDRVAAVLRIYARQNICLFAQPARRFTQGICPRQRASIIPAGLGQPGLLNGRIQFSGGCIRHRGQNGT